MSPTFRFVRSFSFVSSSSHFLMTSSVLLRDSTSCDKNISSCSTIVEPISLAKCFDCFVLWCHVLLTIGASRSASDIGTLHPIDPVYSTTDLSGLSGLWIFISTVHPRYIFS